MSTYASNAELRTDPPLRARTAYSFFLQHFYISLIKVVPDEQAGARQRATSVYLCGAVRMFQGLPHGRAGGKGEKMRNHG